MTYSSMFSSASFGMPQETAPRTGARKQPSFCICRVAALRQPPICSMSRCFMRFRYFDTVDFESPTPAAISRTVGDTPFASA